MPTDTSDRSVQVSRDAIGNTIVTGDNNRVVVYQIRSSVAFEEETQQLSGVSPNPYRGLEAFDENDSARFFGRSRETSDLWETLRRLDSAPGASDSTGRVLPIIGASGSGKSSLARAGLIAELARRPWPGRSPSSVAVMVPGERPLESLAAAMLRVKSKDTAKIEEIRELTAQLARPNAKGEFNGLRLLSRAAADSSQSIVLLIDQFEEAFSTCSDEGQRNTFIENLRLAAVDTSGPLKLVLTLRTDFLPQVQRIDWLNQAITYNGYIVPKMEEPALRAAISEPASQAGYTLDTGTVDLLVEQTRGRDGALPLLQFALSQIWQGLTQTPAVAPADTLRAIGGIGGALANEAQRQFDVLTEPDRAIAKRAFTAGVQLGEPGQETRRRFGISEIVAHGETIENVLRVLRRFSTRDARLLTLFTSLQNPETQVEITHETLISEWPTLRDWVKFARADILFHRRLAEAAKAWKLKTGGLWRSPELDRLRDFHLRARSDFTGPEVEFYQASERQERWETLARRAAIATLAIAAVVTSVLAVWALQQRTEAQRELLIDRAHQLAAESRAVFARYPERSLLLALEAERLGTDTASPEQSLRDALKGLAGHGLGRTAPIKQAFLSANQQWLVIKASEKVHVRAMPAESNPARLTRFLGYGQEHSDLDSSPDHRWLITGGDKDGLALWDLNNQGFPASTMLDRSRVHTFSPDSRWFVASPEGRREVRLWSLQPSFTQTPVVVPLESGPSALAASRSTVVAVLANGTTCEINLSAPASGCRMILLGATAFERLALSADGRILIGTLRTKDAAWHGGHRVAAWFLEPSASTPRTAVLLEDVARMELLALSHDSQWAAITTGTDLNTGNGGLIHLCRLQQASASCFSLDEHRGNVTNILFSPDDKTLISTGWDDTARIWNLETPDPSRFPVVLRGHTNWVTSAAFDPTGQWLATGGADQAVILWNMKGRDVAATGTVFSGTEGAVSTVFFSNDGSRLFSGSGDGALHYWDMKRTLPSADPDVLPVQLGHSDVGTGITFTHDMRWAFTYEGDDGEIFTLRRVTPGKRADDPIKIPFTLKMYMLDAGFSDDSRWLAISDQNSNTTKLYDLSTDDPLHHERDLTGIFPGIRRTRAFSPDSKWFVTFDSAAKHPNAWDLTTPVPTKHNLAVGDISLGDLSFSPDSRWLVFRQDAVLHVIDLKSPNLTDRVLAQDLAKDPSDVWFAPNGRIAYVSAKVSIVIVDPEGKAGPEAGPYMGGNVRIETSPDQTRLLAESNPAVQGLRAPEAQLQRDIARLNGAKSEMQLKLWKWTGKQYDPISSSTTVKGEMHLSKFSPHSHWLLTATDRDTNPTLWNLDSDDPFAHPTFLWGHTVRYNHYWQVAFTTDERWLATAADNDLSVHLWDLRNAHIDQSVISFGGLGGGVSKILISPDDKLLLGLGKGGLRMWRMSEKGVSDVAFNLGTLSKNAEAFEEVMFSPANDELVGWGGQAVRFWALHFANLARKAENAAGRNFTWEEWAQYFPEQEYSKLFPHLPVDASAVSGELDQAHLQILKGNTQKARQFYENADKWSDEIEDPAISNDVAWKGATDNMATLVASAADAAVRMDPNNGWYRDTRALVRALQGDTKGAIDDYESYLQWARQREDEPQSNLEQRRAWLEALKFGSNPFNEKLLRSLRDE